MLKIFAPLKKYDFSDAVKASKIAMQELKAERFNSNTLKTLYYDERYRCNDTNRVIVKSKVTGKPVDIYYKKFADDADGFVHEEFCEYYFYKNNGNKKINVGTKDFSIVQRDGKYSMKPGCMVSKTEEFSGLGIREDELQIKDALRLGIKSIPRISLPEATLYHVKMGFLPVQKLVRVRFKATLDNIMRYMKGTSFGMKKEYFTPIVVEKDGIFGKKYYLDINSTQALANFRYAKEETKNSMTRRPMPPNISKNTDMVLDEEGIEVWNNMIHGRPMFDGIA